MFEKVEIKVENKGWNEGWNISFGLLSPSEPNEQSEVERSKEK